MPDDLSEGVTITPLERNADGRGNLVEWISMANEGTEPIVHVYQATAAPGSSRARGRAAQESGR